jgi:hypothetical protein
MPTGSSRNAYCRCGLIVGVEIFEARVLGQVRHRAVTIESFDRHHLAQSKDSTEMIPVKVGRDQMIDLCDPCLPGGDVVDALCVPIVWPLPAGISLPASSSGFKFKPEGSALQPARFHYASSSHHLVQRTSPRGRSKPVRNKTPIP